MSPLPMRTCSLHGIVLEASGPDAHGLWEALTRTFSPAPAERPAAIRVRFSEPGSSSSAAAAPPTGQPVCHFDAFLGYGRADDLTLTDRRSTVRVRAEAGTIDVQVPQEGPASVHGLVSAPLTVALLLTLRRFGLFHLHGAGVEVTGTEGALLLGRSGAGKSSTALALISAGAGFIGDDAVLLRTGPSGIEALPFPRPFHVAEAVLDAHPHLWAQAGAPYREGVLKRPVPAASVGPEGGRSLLRPRMVLLPRICDQQTSELRPSTGQALLPQVLGASALMLIPGAPRAQEQMSLLGSLVQAARPFELLLGRDMLEAPARAGARLLEALRQALG